MFSRRDFLSASIAASGLAASGGFGEIGRLAAQQNLSLDLLSNFEPLGNITLLHIADLHAQLLPIYFREPSINIGVGEASRQPPHLTDDEFRKFYNVTARSREAYALTASDFSSLAKNYGKMGGVDRIATVVKKIRAERGADKVLLLDGGDAWQGSWTSLKTNAADVVDVMSALGVDATTGHWEFTYGAKRVKELTDSAPFAFLAQNVRDIEWREPVFAASKLFERGGAKIGVLGQAFPRTPVSNPKWMFPEWEFGIRDAELQKEVEGLRAKGADVIVLLSHNGFDLDKKLASRVKGIDIILTGHTHDALPDIVRVGETALIATGSHGKFVSRIDLDVQNKRVAALRYRLIPIFSDSIAADNEMAKIVSKHRAPYEKDLNRELARTESLLYRRGNFNGSFDDLICQAMLAERDVEVALSPGFRWGATLLPGDPITFEAITNATAITYPACYRITMTGEQIKGMLEEIADNLFHPDPYFQAGGDMVRMGGIGYAIDVAKPLGHRISNLTLTRTGKSLEASANYRVAGWASVNEGVEGPPIWSVLEDYLKRAGTVKIQ